MVRLIYHLKEKNECGLVGKLGEQRWTRRLEGDEAEDILTVWRALRSTGMGRWVGRYQEIPQAPMTRDSSKK